MAGKKLPKGYRHAVTAGNSQARISFSGPFFSADANKTLRQNIRRMMQGIADEGAEVAKSRSPVVSGAFRDGIVGRTQGVRGNKWALTAVISQTHVYPWRTRGGRAFGVEQSGTYKIGKRKGQTWTRSDSDVLERMSKADYRGGKVEARYRIFRSVTYQLRAARAVMAENLTKGLE